MKDQLTVEPEAAETAAVGRAKRPKKTINLASLDLPVVTAIAAAALFFAWSQRAEGHITAETGLGYYLGIVGSVLMLALLLYPLRKRFKLFRGIGGVRAWFRIHMLLGVIGPALVLVHSNFKLGSLNSSMALTAMLIVATSGFAGRFFYSKIHRGLYGRKLDVHGLLQDLERLKVSIPNNQTAGFDVVGELEKYEHHRRNQQAGFLRSLTNTLTGPFSRARLKRRLDAGMRDIFNQTGIDFHARNTAHDVYETGLARYLKATAKVEAFTLYERLFSAWHLLHLPLFAIMVLAALLHVVAVHLF